MVSCRQKLFGLDHSSTLRTESTLINLPRWNGQPGDAVELALENIRHVRCRELQSLGQLPLKTRLAIVYLDIGLVDEAQSTQLEALASYMDGPHSDHPYRKAAQVMRARILTKKGEF
jgi:hypothetical protein